VEARVAYIHASLGFPTKAVMMDAASAGRLIGIPFATVTNIREFYPETKAIPKGHLDQQRQDVRSTKAKALDHILQSKKSASNTPHKDVYAGVWDLKHTTYSDQTGRFPYTSHRRNKFVMVMVELDSSAILIEPMKNRSTEELKRA